MRKRETPELHKEWLENEEREFNRVMRGKRMFNVPQHPLPSTRLMRRACIAKRLLPRIIGARGGRRRSPRPRDRRRTSPQSDWRREGALRASGSSARPARASGASARRRAKALTGRH
jgi:hypothetical protein